ncbi:MAG: hypothetical protein DMG38_11715 [Acidobacteria bacterium]|nr:MAG: hypothetical protein DMG38_11715 [Acidobacteriota bacterium]
MTISLPRPRSTPANANVRADFFQRKGKIKKFMQESRLEIGRKKSRGSSEPEVSIQNTGSNGRQA